MAQHTIPVIVCDRCRFTCEARSISDHYQWGRIHVEQVNGPLGIGRGGERPVFKDICPDCLKQVCTWFSVHPTPRGGE